MAAQLVAKKQQLNTKHTFTGVAFLGRGRSPTEPLVALWGTAVVPGEFLPHLDIPCRQKAHPPLSTNVEGAEGSQVWIYRMVHEATH